MTIHELFFQSPELRLEVRLGGIMGGVAAVRLLSDAIAEGIGTPAEVNAAHMHITDLSVDDVRSLLSGYDTVYVSEPRQPALGSPMPTAEALRLFDPDAMLEASFWEV